MGRIKKTDETRRVQVNAGVLPSVSDEIDAIAIAHHLTRSRAAELLLARGLAAYQRDGSLTETFTPRTVQVAFVEPKGKPSAKAK